MMNIYNGVVLLDSRGEATVQLPEWFEALNGNYRYQLTAIGAPAPNLHIAQEVAMHQFKIGGGSAGLKVSWQITGIRQDAWANAHRIPVEVDKSAVERDHYIHPELFGAPPTDKRPVGAPSWDDATARRSSSEADEAGGHRQAELMVTVGGRRLS